MIIECKGCFKKFKLNERLLKPQGSRVRCSKCGEIFLAFPSETTEPLKSTAGVGREGWISDNSECATAGSEKRSYPRIPVSIPAVCNDLDSEGNQLDLQIGVIKEVSQAGVAVELFSSPVSEVISLFFINDGDKDVQICGRVAHTKMNSACKVRVGLSLLGSPVEIYHFVTQAVKTHDQSGTNP